jgi:inosine-uridine nucleoside N-ribohydrolase
VQAVMRRTFTERDMSGFYLHDPLAVAVAVDPSLVTGLRRRAEVSTIAETRGKTTLSMDHEHSLVATEVDAERFIRNLGHALALPDGEHTIGFERAE